MSETENVLSFLARLFRGCWEGTPGRTDTSWSPPRAARAPLQRLIGGDGVTISCTDSDGCNLVCHGCPQTWLRHSHHPHHHHHHHRHTNRTIEQRKIEKKTQKGEKENPHWKNETPRVRSLTQSPPIRLHVLAHSHNNIPRSLSLARFLPSSVSMISSDFPVHILFLSFFSFIFRSDIPEKLG